MSDEEQATTSAESATRMLTAEYKDGQLEIVEVTPYDKHDKIQNLQGHIIEDADGHSGVKYMQVLDGKNVVVDLLNLTLVKCEDGQETYRLVGEEGDDTTVTCVLANDDGEDQDGQENQESYVFIEGNQGEPVVFLQSALQQASHTKIEAKEEKQAMSPSEILEKAKALQKAKALLPARGAGGGAGGDSPPGARAGFLSGQRLWLVAGCVGALLLLALLQALCTLARARATRQEQLIPPTAWKEYTSANTNYAFEPFENDDKYARSPHAHARAHAHAHTLTRPAAPPPQPPRHEQPAHRHEPPQHRHEPPALRHEQPQHRHEHNGHVNGKPNGHSTAGRKTPSGAKKLSSGANGYYNDTRSLQRPRSRYGYDAPDAGSLSLPRAAQPDFYFMPSQRKHEDF